MPGDNRISTHGKKTKILEKYQVWINVRKRYHLSNAHIQMARELGMNPKKFGKIANHKQEPWKTPILVFIQNLYFRRFGKKQPDEIKSIEQLANKQREKKAKRLNRKQVKKRSVVTSANGLLHG